MIRRTFRGIIQLLGGLGAGLAIILMVVAWQLSSGPISLAFLSPYITDAVNSGQRNFKLTMKDTILTWAGWERTLDIRVLGVKVLRPDGSLVGSVPEVSFSLSGKALVSGLFAPKSIELFGPRLRVRREYSGAFDIGFLETEAQSTDFAQRLFNQLLAAPDPDNAMSYLTRLEIVSAEVTLDDELLGKSWVTPSAHVSLRRDATGIKGDVDLELDIDNRQTEFTVSGGYQTALKRFNLAVNFNDVSPAAFSSMYYELGPLRDFSLPLSGTVTLGVTLDGAIEWAGFNLTGGRGLLNLPHPIAQTVPVQKVALNGRYDGADNTLDVEALTLDLGAEGHVTLPAPADHRMPLKSISLKGRYLGKTHRLEITKASADLGGPSADLSVVVDGFAGLQGAGSEAKMSVDVKGTLRDVPVDRLAQYWPAAWGRSAHRWTTTHLSDGMVRRARAEMRLWSGGDGGFELVSVDGDLEVDGVTVDYLPPMPPVRDTRATMKFDEKDFNIFISGARSEGLVVGEGSVLISGLDEYDQYADVTLGISGPFRDQLAYIDHPPLRFTSALGIDPATTGGQAETDLKLRFILEDALTLDRVQVSAKARAADVAVADAVLGRDIDGGMLDIRVDKAGMDVAGTVNVGKIPATLAWRENFGPKPAFRRRYDLKAHIADTRDVAELGLDVAPFTDKYVRGALDAEVRFTIIGEHDQRLEITTDIADAEISAPAFGWSKRHGVPGEARITVDLDGEKIRGVPNFAIAADDLSIAGRAIYEGDAGLRRIDFDRISFGRTELKGALIARGGGGWDAGFHGASFDMSAMWKDLIHGGPEDAGDQDFPLPYLTLAVELDRVWIGPDRALRDISGTFAHKDDVWNTVLVKGELEGAKPFELTILPDDLGNRMLVMTSADAGATLRAMDFYDDMQGGTLEITGTYDEGMPGRPLRGTLNVKGYRITDAPVLTRVLSIMALTGIVEALQGDGLAFGSLEIPFVLGDGWLEIKNAKAAGTSLGFTASGTVFTYADVIDVSGTVVPAYAINSALGRLPVVGDIFTGGEKGGGVFAANYTMSGPASEPKVAVNPLAALTPGIFRSVFDIFGQVEVDSTPEAEVGVQ
ncbi:MAG: AsmA-like C-terminal region-containing protein [Rhodospirillales bacterium]